MSFPILFLRIKALMIDSIAIVLIYFSLVVLCIKFDVINPDLKLFILLTPTILFEPILIWLTGGSLGHHYAEIKIVDNTTGKNLFILQGLIRFLTKTLLGAYSFLTMLTTKKHRAIHDVLSGSLVLFKDESRAPTHHKLAARDAIYTTRKPSLIKRLMVISVHGVISLIVFSIAVQFLASPTCLVKDTCTDGETLILGYTSLGWFLSLFLIFVLGLFCKLPGVFYRADKTT